MEVEAVDGRLKEAETKEKLTAVASLLVMFFTLVMFITSAMFVTLVLFVKNVVTQKIKFSSLSEGFTILVKNLNGHCIRE